MAFSTTIFATARASGASVEAAEIRESPLSLAWLSIYTFLFLFFDKEGCNLQKYSG